MTRLGVSRRLTQSRRFSQVGASVAALVGGLVLVGWWLDEPLLKSGIPGLVAMNPITAIGFVLTGAAVQAFHRRSFGTAFRWALRCLALGAVLLALLSLSRLFTPWDLGPDRLLFPEGLNRDGAGYINRMAPTTGSNFVLVGLALLLLDVRSRRWRRIGIGLAALAGLSGLIVLVGYVYGSGSLDAVGSAIPMAINTACGFVLLALAILAARPNDGPASLLVAGRIGGTLARRLLPWAFAVPLAFGWLQVSGLEARLYDSGGGTAIMAIATTVILTIMVWMSALRVARADQARSLAEEQLLRANEGLEARVADRTRILRRVIDENPQMVFMKDWEGRFVLANRAVADVYGTTMDNLVGKTDADFNADAAQVAAFLQADRQVMSTCTTAMIPAEPVRDAQTGATRWFDTVKVPIVGADGTCRQLLGISTDITARRRAEEELRRTGDELRGWFAASPLAMCSLSMDLTVQSWNRAAEQLFGWTPEEIIGQKMPMVPPGREGEAKDLHVRVMAGHEITSFETQRRRKDGTLVDVSISTAGLFNTSGTPSGFVAVYADISERKALESQLRQSQRIEAVGQLAGGVAHDFNNILTVIKSAAEFLQADLDNGDPRRNDALAITEAAERASTLTRQLLAFSRRQVLQLQVLNLNDVVSGIEPMLRRLVTSNIDVHLRLAPDLALVRADAGQLDQVLVNLVINARDAMPNGGRIVIETSSAAPRDVGDHASSDHPVMLRVRDTGAGMDAATKSRIFEPFFTTKGVGAGTGLGLATVYGIIKQLGGQVQVESEVGCGTTFSIYLPLHPGSEVEVRTAPRSGFDEISTGATILLVEDDPAVRGMVERVLSRRNYAVITAASGSEALVICIEAAERIDMVLSDMMMPEMNGLELRRRLAENGFTKPVVLMSGFPADAIAQQASGAGVGPILQKPFAVEKLLEVVEDALAGNAIRV